MVIIVLAFSLWCDWGLVGRIAISHSVVVSPSMVLSHRGTVNRVRDAMIRKIGVLMGALYI